MELLFRLVDKTQHGVKRIREAVACGTGAAFVSTTSIRLFNILGSKTLQKPMYKTHVDQLLEAMYRAHNINKIAAAGKSDKNSKTIGLTTLDPSSSTKYVAAPPSTDMAKQIQPRTIVDTRNAI